MGSGLSTNDPTIVAAFHKALFEQGFAIFLILTLVAVAWTVLRSVQLRRAAVNAAATGGSVESRDMAASAGDPEPVARHLLRVSFGLLWIFDGVLQGQASMPLGMIPQVIQPTASASPNWVQHLVDSGTKIWTYHPVSAAAATVWIQVGIGLWLLAAPRGDWSRLAGVASVGWGALVWVFGESFGGIFAPGASWLFGAPGAVVFYCIAGILIALPDISWRSGRLGRAIVAAAGLFLVGMAVLQAWPGRGFWQGQATSARTAGGLTAMVQQMAQTPQPHLMASLVSDFASLDASHGWAVNLVVVVWLAAVGAAFLTGRPQIVRAGVIAGAVLCLADWVFVQDFGFFGGVGTDPNSMIPITLLFVAGYIAMVRAPVATTSPATASAQVPWRQHLSADPAYTFRSIAALAAVGVTLVGVAPMAYAAANPNADTILTQAVDGPPTSTNIPAPAFDLMDQNGRQVTLTGLHGKALAVTFLDPVCTSDCPVIAQEFRSAAKILGAESQDVELIAIDANPRYTSPLYLTAFDKQEGLQNVSNWEYLTGPLPVLAARMGRLRGRGRLRKRRSHDRSQRRRLHHRPGRKDARGAELRPRTGHRRDRFSLLPDARIRAQERPSRRVRLFVLARPGLGWAAAGALTIASLASCSSTVSTSGGASPNTDRAEATPLATSVTTTAGTWATVAMGQLDQPDNTFWQLLHRSGGAGSWTNQIQATAVATNGGLVLAPSLGSSLVVGVRTYGLLTFSPLIATGNGGRTWTNGLLPSGLASAPNTLAVNAQGQALAIVGKDQTTHSQSVLTSDSLTTWQPLTSGDVLAATPAGQQCAPLGLSAVAFDGTDPVIGARCSRAGVVGLFERKGSAWVLAGPRLPAPADPDLVSVTALQATGHGLSGLLSASGPDGAAVTVVSTDDAGQTWKMSQPLQLTAPERVASVGSDGSGGFFVLLSGSAGPDRAAVLGADQSQWRELPLPPAGTATLAFGPGTSVEALAVDTATLTVWTLGSTGGWHKGQVMTVSIDYGSSS